MNLLLTSFSSATLYRNLFVGLVLLLGSLSAQAQITQTWSGTVSTDWNTANNWTPAGVPTTTSDVVIPSGTPGGPIIVTTATAKSVEVQSGASLNISSAGSLTINNSKTLSGFTNALFSIGTVTNNGQIIIDITASVSQFGLWNRGTFTNTGQIRIDRTTAQALRNPSGTSATFINSGTITIGGSATVNDNGILNQATFQNNAGGLITIDQVTGTAGAGLFNGGASGMFINSATITIGASTSLGGTGLNNSSGSFTNAAGSQLIINRTGGDGVSSTGTFVNSATLSIGNIAFAATNNISNFGSFTNNVTGEIRIDGGMANGLWNRQLVSTFLNNGKIFVGSVASTTMGVGILCDGVSFTNTAGGEIHIDRTSRGMTNVKLFYNAGQIRIGQNAPIRGGGILNGNGSNTTGAVFNNLPGGDILIDRVLGEEGITNEGSTTFSNGGTVAIGASGTIVGNAIYNTGTFINLPCAVIRAFAPAYNENGTLTNNGFLTVSTTRNPTKTVVRVNAPAGIAGSYVFAPAGYGPLIRAVNLTANAVLVNDGTANPALGCNALVNGGAISGKIALVDRGGVCASNVKVYNAQQAGAIAVIMLSDIAGPPPGMSGGVYASLITIPAMSMTQADGAAIKAALTPGPVNISIRQEEQISTALVNNGIISYPQGNPIPNVTNNGVIAAPLQICYQTPYAPALQLGASNTLTVGSNWFTDPSLNTQAGPYDQNTNTFTPSFLNAVNPYQLSFPVTDAANGCVRTITTSATVSFPVSITAQPAASSVVCEFGSVSVPVGVTGTVLSFQWYKNGSAVVGQTSATLSLPNAQPSDTGTYSLVITGGCNSSTSTAFSLSVGAAPVVTLIFGNSATVMGTGIPTITLPAGATASNFQATGGSRYERSIVIDRINSYEIRTTDDNMTGIFPINRLGLFTLTVTGAGGCKRTVQAILQGQ